MTVQLTVKEGSGVNAVLCACNDLAQVPHFVQRCALRERDCHAYDEEDGVQDDGSDTEHPECAGDGWGDVSSLSGSTTWDRLMMLTESKVCKKNRGLDAEYVAVVHYLNRERCLTIRKSAMKSEL